MKPPEQKPVKVFKDQAKYNNAATKKKLGYAKTYRSVAVGVHELPQGRVFLDLELHDGVVLPQHLEVNVLRLGTLGVLDSEKKNASTRS